MEAEPWRMGGLHLDVADEDLRVGANELIEEHKEAPNWQLYKCFPGHLIYVQKQVWGDAKYLHEACELFRAGVEAPKQCIRPSILLLPSQCVNDHRPHCIAVLWNSNSSSFPAAVFVAPKAVFMKVSVFLMSAPFDSFNSLSAELAGRVTVSRRNNIGGYFFWLRLPLPLLFTCMPSW